MYNSGCHRQLRNRFLDRLCDVLLQYCWHGGQFTRLRNSYTGNSGHSVGCLGHTGVLSGRRLDRFALYTIFIIVIIVVVVILHRQKRIDVLNAAIAEAILNVVLGNGNATGYVHRSTQEMIY